MDLDDQWFFAEVTRQEKAETASKVLDHLRNKNVSKNLGIDK